MSTIADVIDRLDSASDEEVLTLYATLEHLTTRVIGEMIRRSLEAATTKAMPQTHGPD